MRSFLIDMDGVLVRGPQVVPGTDAFIESGMETILVLTGVTRREDVDRFPYRPARIVESVGGIEL